MTGPGSRPHILRVVTRLNVGGPARHALLLCRELADEYRTTLAAGRPAASEGEMSDPGVQVVRVPLVRPLSAYHDPRALFALRRLLATGRPVLVHTHMAKAGTLGRVAALTVRPRPKVVHTFHGHVLEGYFGRRSQRAFVEVERQLARRSDALIAVSPEIRDQLLDLGIGRASQFTVIPVGLELARLLAVDRPRGTLRRHLGLAPDVPLVGAVGRLVPIKDNVTLLAAVEPLPGVHLALVGDGELRSTLEERARQLGMADRVHVTGWWDDLAAAYSDLDVVALTSRNEGTPLALIEAGAAGRPVVSTDVGGVRSVVADGVSGILTPPGDPTAVSRALARLLAEPDLRRRMGQAGRDRVRERFGHQRLLADIRTLYAQVLSGQPFEREMGDRSGG